MIYAREIGIVPSVKALSKESQEEYGKWLSVVFGREPRVGLGTYTFRDPPTELTRTQSTVGRQYVARAANSLVALLTASGTTFFVALEEGSSTRRLHLHALESSKLQESQIVHRWWAKKYGFESYRRVSSLEGVSLYVAKYVTKQDLPFWAGGPGYRSLDRGEKIEAVSGAYVASSSG